MTVSEWPVVITLTVLLAIQPVCCTQSTYYVKPTPDTPCPSEPCLTLSEYAQGAGPPFTSNTTMVFLPGDHRLDNDMIVTNIISFTMVGDSTTLPEITSNIVCTGPAVFVFQDILYLKICALELSYCGSATHTAMQLRAVPHFKLTNSVFHNSRNSSLVTIDSDLTITETRFHGSTSAGLVLSGCTAEFLGRNVFSNNLRSGVHSYNSILSFNGSTTFVNNSGVRGGGIYSENTVIYSTGQCTTYPDDVRGVHSIVRCDGEMAFVQNSAEDGGGIFALRGSDLWFNGNVTFVSNSAAQYGGGILMQNSNLICKGFTSFITNSADGIGGGISGTGGNHVVFNGNTTFTDNQAQHGGVIFVGNSEVNLSGYTSFVNNCASYGGGLRVQDSTIGFEGVQFFYNNSAKQRGGGMLILNSKFSCERLSNTSFVHNFAMDGGGIQIEDSVLSCEGLASFINNLAETGGGIYCIGTQMIFSSPNDTAHYDGTGAAVSEMKNDSIMFSNGSVTFVNNEAGIGGGIYSFNCSVIMNCSCTLTQNFAHYIGGGGMMRRTVLTLEGTSIFVNNTAEYIGGAMYVLESSQVTLAGTAKFIHNSAGYGGGTYLYDSSLTVTRNTYFYTNTAISGGGVHGTMATITINGSTILESNSASMHGGGLSLSSSQCFLAANGTMDFIKNHAEQNGGAIYVADDPFLYCSFVDNVTLGKLCFFQLQGLSYETDSIIVRVKSNTAGKAGAAVYGGMLDRCKLEPYSSEHASGQIFDTVFGIQTQQNLSTSVIASDPNHVCPCSDGQPDCSTNSINITVYPGEAFLVPVVAVGQRNGTVPAIVKTSLSDGQSMLGSLQGAQPVNNTCTTLQYTIFSNSSKDTMTLKAEGPCLELEEPLQIYITLHQCPTGFMLSNVTKACICEKRLQEYTANCNITNRKMDRDREFWVGVDSDFGGTILHPHCPFDYCKSQPVSFTLNETDLECNYDRTGLLCGGCQPGLSNVLGSSHCLKCSSACLSLLIPFALAGIVLVAFLLLCKLTVTVGSINGLIFYANIIAVNHSVFLPSGKENVLTIFIAWLNLDLGIETCFYDGMDTYARTWLQFAFPLYVWVMVGTIIILSHYYSTVARMFGRNPIAVLATLFLLSYAKLLRTIIAVLSFTYLEYPDGTEVAVWLYDGNVRYLKGKHIPLFLIALLVLLLLFLPYSMLLFFGQWIQARSEVRIFAWISNYRVKPFLDAYHAPYKNEYRYWPGLLLVLRCILFLVFAFNVLGSPSVNLLTISVCIMGLFTFTRFTGKVYTNQYLDAIDASYMLNTGVLAGGTFYVRSVGGGQEILTYISLSVAFTTFIGILVYHVIAQVRDSHLWREVIWPTLQQQTPIVHRDLSDTETEPEIISVRAPSTTSVNLRELLLEDIN